MQDDRTASRATEFAFDLHRALVADTTGNLVCSPFGLFEALMATLAGTRSASARELGTVLGLAQGSSPHALEALRALSADLAQQAQADPELSLAIANALWVRSGTEVVQETVTALTDRLGVELRSFDYRGEGEAARREVNAWAAKATQGRVDELLSPGDIHALTTLIVTNAVHFQGTWARPFATELTRPRTFRTDDRARTEVPFMNGTLTCPYAELDRVQWVELAYGDGPFALMVVVPPGPGDLAAVEGRLDGKRWGAARARLESREVALALPRISVRSPLALESALRRLGVRKIFDASADLSGFAGAPGELIVDKIVQEAVIDVDEAGTEAAAATAVLMAPRGMRQAPPPVTCVVDRPFLIVLYERQRGTVLFTARVTDPSS